MPRRCGGCPTGGAALATYDGQHGNPVLLLREVWAKVIALAIGDVGARPWLAANPRGVVEVPCDGTGFPRDMDTPADLAALRFQPCPRRLP